MIADRLARARRLKPRIMITDYRAGAADETPDSDARFSTICIHAGQEPDPLDGRDHHADLPDVDLRAGGARPAQGLRVRAHAESDARGARSQPRRDRGRPRRRSRSRRACRPSRDRLAPAVRRSRRRHRQHLRRHVPAVRQGDDAVRHHVQLTSTPSDLDGDATRVHAGDAAGRSSRRRPTRSCGSPTSGGAGRRSRTSTARILAVDNTFASPCLQRPLELGADLSCTARRSTSTATATRSAASSSPRATRTSSGCGSSRTRPARS